MPPLDNAPGRRAVGTMACSTLPTMSATPPDPVSPDMAADTARARTPAREGRLVVRAVEGNLTVQDHHLHVERPGSSRVRTLAAGDIRRIQLDIELGRPATLAIVPNSGSEAELMTVHREEFEAMAAAVLHLAIAIDDASRS